MDRNIAARREAQRLAKSGQIDKAIEAYETILSSGDADPYDFVYCGDLLVKAGRPEEAIERYQRAVDAYSKLGFGRNAVALCRKILRLEPGRIVVWKRLGDLYAAEELIGDAMDAYLTYLRNSSPDPKNDEFREALRQSIALAPARAQYAREVAELLVSWERPEDAADLLLEAAKRSRASGKDEEAEVLLKEAREIQPEVVAAMEEASVEASPEGAVGEEPVAESVAVEETVADPEIGSFGDLQAEGSRENQDSVDAPAVEEDLKQREATDPRPLEVERIEDFEDTRIVPAERPAAGDGERLELREMDAGGQKAPVGRDARGDPAAFGEIDRQETEEHERAAAAQEQLRQPEGEAGRDRGSQATTLDEVELLLEAARVSGERGEMIRALLLKGDLLIQAEEFEGARRVFEEVLDLDPEEPTALRRMKRFEEMGVGAGGEVAPPTIGEVVARGEALVEIAAEGSIQSDGTEWREIGALLDQFKAQLRAQVDPGDFQAHYDLGVSHLEMGLFAEALEEFELAEKGGLPDRKQALRLAELKAKCLSELDRHEEAIGTLRTALDGAGGEEDPEVVGLVLLLARELAETGKKQEAVDLLAGVVEGSPGYSEAIELLRKLSEAA